MSSIDKPIRVLCVFSTLDSGGAESMCMNLYRQIDRDRVQFDFVKHTREHGVFEDEIKNLGGHIYVAPRLTSNSIITYTKWWMNHLANHPEHHIVHGHFFSIATIYFRVAKRMGRATIGHVHASAPNNLLRKVFEASARSKTDYKIACSKDAGEWYYGNSPYLVLNNALDTSEYAYDHEKRKLMREEHGLEDAFVLGTVANLSKVKNPMGLIDIFLKIRAREPKAKLLWVGEGAMRSKIEERISDEGIENEVLLIGHRNDVSSLLQGMDAFLLPSLSEGLPLSVIEAQAAGLPCYLSSVITHEVDVTGLCHFLKLGEWDSWAKAILSNQSNRIVTSEAIINAGYDVRASAAWLQELYIKIMQSS